MNTLKQTRRGFLQRIGLGAAALTLGRTAFGAVEKAGSKKPNIVLIFTDDMGYSDIGPFGATKHKTPHLDRMAREGIKFTDFYVSSSACTPSRAALLTGCYADRIGMGASVVFPGDKRGLNPSEITIAEMLKAKGYTSGCFGKWHLGDQPEFMPLAHGFDVYEGIPYSNDMWRQTGRKQVRRKHPPLPYIKQDKIVAHIPDVKSQAELTDAYTDAAVSFIKANRDKPFFAYLPHSAPHVPLFANRARLKAAGGNVYKALITEIDNSVGRIIAAINESGIAKNTLVIFTNDNGGFGKALKGPLRGGKFGPKYEGHMRVSTLAWWPGRIPAGAVTSQIGTTADIFPTIAKLVGGEVPADRIIDGKDISDILLGKKGAKSPHTTLFYEVDGVRQGNWKYVRYRKKADWFEELYRLDQDLGEQNNLAARHPERVKAMGDLLQKHRASLKANTRAAGFSKAPKVLLEDPAGLPTLFEYRKTARR